MEFTDSRPRCGAAVTVMPERATSAWVLSDGSGIECSGLVECPGCGMEISWSASERITGVEFG